MTDDEKDINEVVIESIAVPDNVADIETLVYRVNMFKEICTPSEELGMHYHTVDEIVDRLRRFRDRDMLTDIFDRNKKFTDHAVANSPREGHFKQGLKTGAKEIYDIVAESKFVSSAPPGFGKQEMMDALSKMLKEIENEPPWRREEIFVLNIVAMYREIGEFVDNFPAKWWGRGTWKEKREEALEELIDLMHFIMIAFDLLDCGPEDIHRRYVEKNDHNWERFKKKLGWDQNNEKSNKPRVKLITNDGNYVFVSVDLVDGVSWPKEVMWEDRKFIILDKHDEKGMMQYTELKEAILSEKEVSDEDE